MAGPGVVTDDQCKYPDGQKRMNKSAKYAAHDVEQDAKEGPQDLRRKEGLGQMRFQRFRMAANVGKCG